ncbi:hypothetical protein D3C71_1624230 [compost metagenome]
MQGGLRVRLQVGPADIEQKAVAERNGDALWLVCDKDLIAKIIVRYILGNDVHQLGQLGFLLAEGQFALRGGSRSFRRGGW